MGERAGGQGCSSPGPLPPRPSCSHGCLEILAHPAKRTSLKGGTPGALCWARSGWSPHTWARGRRPGPPPFKVSRNRGALFLASGPRAGPPSRAHPSVLQSGRSPQAPGPFAPRPRSADPRREGPQGRGSGRLRRGGRPPHPARGCPGDACRRGPPRATRGNFLAVGPVGRPREERVGP